MDDSVLEWMRRNNIAKTRENHLEAAFMGTPPVDLDAEQEFDLPERFQTGTAGRVARH